MLTVSLFRHGKSSWANPRLEDFERPLAPRGSDAVPVVAAQMAARDIQPDLVLCSPARRSRETLELALPRMGAKPEIVYDERLYHASSAAMLDILRGLGSKVRHVMIVGHNPGLHALALDLFCDGDPKQIRALTRKFPTSSLAVITFDIDDWSALNVGEGHLQLFLTPKLAAA